MATIIRPGLFLVIERFPDRRDVFKHFYAEQESFRSLCENYRQCLEALHYWAQADRKNAATRHREYHKLLHELEGELLRYSRSDGFTEIYF